MQSSRPLESVNDVRITLNENEEIVASVKEGLKMTGGYCPCRTLRTPEYKCMCKEFRDQIRDPGFEGYCHCMLYYKHKDGAGEQTAASVREE